MSIDGGTLRIALYSGIFVEHDAVSNSLKCKLKALQALQANGADLDISVFTRHSDYVAPYIHVLDSVEPLLRRREFWDADLHMFEFAMRYDLFDSVFLIPRDRPVVVTEHNTTPPELVDDPVMKRECALSLVQRHNMSLAHRVVCDSEFNLEVCRGIGLPEEMLSVLHLPPGHAAPTAGEQEERSSNEGRVRLLYVGRFVRAKGVSDLLEAVEALWRTGEDRFDLTLVGNPAFSEAAVAREVTGFVDRHAEDRRARLVPNAGDQELATMFARSDALVIPSHHEGYCVPAVEALTASCYVIGYDSGNLPNVVGGLGSLVPAGEIDALSESIRGFVEAVCDARASGAELLVPADAGSMNRTNWLDEVAGHLRDYSPAHYERVFLQLVGEVSEASRAGTPSSVRTAISRRIAELERGDGLTV